MGSTILFLFLFAATTSIVRAQTIDLPVLDHFWFEHIDSPQTVGYTFSFTITAKDQYGDTYTGLNGYETLQDLGGFSKSVYFENGTVFATVSIHHQYDNDRLYIFGTIGESNTFDVKDLPVLNHFWFGNIDSPQTVGKQFSFTITAKDQYNNTYSALNDTEKLSDFTGITTTVDFQNGVGYAHVTISKAATNDKISIKGYTGESNSFNVNDNLSIIYVVAGILLVVCIVVGVIAYKKMKKRSLPPPLPPLEGVKENLWYSNCVLHIGQFR
jgi:hypothetical protein